ncbi:MAG: caspase family protein [Pseudomonadota bacterium]
MLTGTLRALCAAIVILAGPALAETRVALVIGNSAYQHTTPLANPENDARDMAAKLSSLGFDIVEGYNLGLDELEDTVRSFAREASRADLSVFYYAGHGMSVDNINYIVPIDATLESEIDWEFEVYEVERILRYVQRANHASLIFLDACRDNPLADKLALLQGMGTRSISNRGISRIPTETLGTTGTVIAYATEPGQVASDGAGKNSPFTAAVLNHIGAANTDFAALTSRITRDVLASTDNVQRPRFDISLTGELFLNKVDTPITTSEVTEPTTPAPAQDTNLAVANLTVQTAIFEAAQASDDAADYQAYLDQFPNGPFAPLARNAIERLTRVASVPIDTETTVTDVAAGPSIGQEQVTRMMSTPLALTATPAVQAQPANADTLRALNLDDRKRREVQLRLTLANIPVGAIDGDIGPTTRRGISAWQTQNQLQPTGYLNASQLEILMANTDVAFRSHMAANPTALDAPVRRQPARVSTGTSSSSSSNNSGGAAAAAAAGVIGGVILCKALNC